jgi:hypothetical protein
LYINIEIKDSIINVILVNIFGYAFNCLIIIIMKQSVLVIALLLGVSLAKRLD